MTPERWAYVTEYLRRTFGAQDAHLERLLVEAEAEGLPPIAVSADVGRLLQILASTTGGLRALELGTLGGYSAVWIARGLRPEGRLVTVEADARHAAFAERQLARAGLAERVEVRRGRALDVLDALPGELGGETLDFVFFDAVKTEYPEYFRRVRGLVAPGGMVVADNVLGTSEWWIDQEGHPSRDAVDALNRAVAADPAFDAVALPIREGVLVARRRA